MKKCGPERSVVWYHRACPLNCYMDRYPWTWDLILLAQRKDLSQETDICKPKSRCSSVSSWWYGDPGLTFIRRVSKSSHHRTFLPVLAGTECFHASEPWLWGHLSVVVLCQGNQTDWSSLSEVSELSPQCLNKASYQDIKGNTEKSTWLPLSLHAHPLSQFTVYGTLGSLLPDPSSCYHCSNSCAPFFFALLLFNPLKAGFVQVTYLSSRKRHLIKFQRTPFYERDGSLFASRHLSFWWCALACSVSRFKASWCRFKTLEKEIRCKVLWHLK